MQRDMASQMESIRKTESDLLRRARDAEKPKAVKADAEPMAGETADSQVEAVTVVDDNSDGSAAATADIASAPPAHKSRERAQTKAKGETAASATETAQNAAASQQTQAQSAQAQPSEEQRFERPAERLARMQGRVLRDDAALRNASRPQPEPSSRPAPLQRRPGDRPPVRTDGAPAGRPGFGSPRPYAPRDGQPRTGDRPPMGGGFAPRDGAPRPAPGVVRKRPGAPAAAPVAEPQRKAKASNYDPNKANYVRVFDTEKKTKSRKALERERSALLAGGDEDASAQGRRKKRKSMIMQRPEPVRIEKAVITSESVTVKTLADRIGKPASDIIKRLMMLGIIVTINHEIEYDTAALVAADFGIELEKKIELTAEETLAAEGDNELDANLIKRPPVITIMGHVDHGKTSLLDKIRSTRVTEGEAGGITQHIGAYSVNYNNRSITFLDTPGHEAFTAMRARGAQVTDAVVLVVAADDGIMPQTVEAINHAKAAGVPIIVAINKIDLPDANPDRVLQELTEHSLVWEEWGGETVVNRVSAKTGEGIDELLEMILLVTDVLELRANPSRPARGTIVEAKLDKGRGPVATVLVQNGTLRVGNTVVAGTSSGRIRAMLDDTGRRVDEAGPSKPVEVLGLDFVPLAGDILNAVEDSGLTKQVVEERRNRIKSEQMKLTARVTLDDLYQQIKEGQVKDLNIIVKADVQGSVEAVRQSLEKLSNDQVRVHCIHGGAGAIVATDVMLASASNAIIIGFNVRPDGPARAAAEKEGVDIRLYRIIYNAIEDIEKAMKGMLEPVFEEVVLGRVEVRELFRVSAIGTIAGCMVRDGKITRNADIRLLRDNIVIHEGKLASLKRFKDDVREVLTGFECGLSLQNFNDLKEGDIIEAFTQQKVEQ
jgi:translation initiation factor IF-2